MMTTTMKGRLLACAIAAGVGVAPVAHGYFAGGGKDATKGNGHIESLDRHVTPRSLYLTQLRERLGDAAVRQIATAGQI